MTNTKTSGLEGLALDWAVAQCEFVEVEYVDDEITQCLLQKPSGRYAPSTDWAQCGPIIEREGIGIWPSESGEHDGEWCARTISTYITYSPTPLVAAMRCYVASKLGDEVDIKYNEESSGRFSED